MKMKMEINSTDSNPWDNIQPPENGNQTRTDSKWNVFWVIWNDCPALAIRHDISIKSEIEIPKLKEITIEFLDEQTGVTNLVFSLNTPENRDIFYILCKDIIDSMASEKSEKAAVEIALRRAWRWHHLLKGGKASKLTSEEQKKLIGDLLLIERYLLKEFDYAYALNCWRSPLNEIKEFDLKTCSVLSTIKYTSPTNHLRIRGEDYLDLNNEIFLYLRAWHFEDSDHADETSFSLETVVVRLSKLIESVNPLLVSGFTNQLYQKGFSYSDDYSNDLFTEGKHMWYHVTHEFPKIIPSFGIYRVTYRIYMSEISKHEINENTIPQLLRGD